jgi:hypothetical protein
MLVPRRQPCLTAAAGGGRRRCLWAAGLMLLALGRPLPAGAALAESPWEFDPYRLQIVVAIANQPRFAGSFSQVLIDDLLKKADAYVGACWVVEAALADRRLALKMLRDPDALTRDDLPDGWRLRDKVIVVAIDSRGGQFELSFREFDVLTESWQPASRRVVPQQALLAEEAFRGLLAAFAPLAEIESVENKSAQLRWRSGALAPRDSNLVFAPPGTVLKPFLRLTDRQGKTRKIEPVDWTYLVAGAAEAGHGTATIYTGVRSGLGGKRRGRVQQLALAIRGPQRGTRLEIRSRTDEKRPLAGYEVYAHAPEQKQTTLIGHTGHDGSLSIPPGPTPLRLLIVKNGNELLARLPIVPGLQPVVTARLADDAPRLAVEAFVMALQERLVDVVVRRHVLLSRLKLRIDERKFDDADRLLEELRRLDGQQQFLLALDQQEQKTVSSDALVQAKIDKMLANARKLVGQYLDPRELSRAEIELDTARRAQVSAGVGPQGK